MLRCVRFCRRKKKCIRFSGGADDGTEEDDHDGDGDGDHDDDCSDKLSAGSEMELDVEQCDDGDSDAEMAKTALETKDCADGDSHSVHSLGPEKCLPSRQTRSLDGLGTCEPLGRPESTGAM